MYLTRNIAHRSNTVRRLFSYSMATTMTTMMVSHNPTSANSVTPFTTKAVEESPSTQWRTLQQMHELYQNGRSDRRMPSSSSTSSSSSSSTVNASDSSSSPSSSPPPLPRRHFDELSLPSSSRSEALRTMRGRSGVLIGLFTHPRTGQVHVLLTQRSQELRSHAGDVAFPGGKMDPTDPSIISCALRESHEEIGLVRTTGDEQPRQFCENAIANNNNNNHDGDSAGASGVRILATGRSAISKNGLEVIPIIAQVPIPRFLLTRDGEDIKKEDLAPAFLSTTSSSTTPIDDLLRDSFLPILNSSEVAVLFSIPLSHFLIDSQGYRFKDIDWLGSRVRMHEFIVKLPRSEWLPSTSEEERIAGLSLEEQQQLQTGERTFRIWGLTAFMSIGAAMELHGRKPTFSVLAAAVPKTTTTATTTATTTNPTSKL